MGGSQRIWLLCTFYIAELSSVPDKNFLPFSSHYEIQPEGLVQQISYSTERESGILRLVKEEDISRLIEHGCLPFDMFVSLWYVFSFDMFVSLWHVCLPLAWLLPR